MPIAPRMMWNSPRVVEPDHRGPGAEGDRVEELLITPSRWYSNMNNRLMAIDEVIEGK